MRVLLEAAVRCCDGVELQRRDVEALLDWRRLTAAGQPVHVPFKPGRVILQVSGGGPTRSLTRPDLSLTRPDLLLT